MERLECDVLVVGAGPAGTSAARAAASRGARVVVVERRAVIGVPVRCAEYIPAVLLGEAGVGRRFVVQPIRGMRTYCNGRCLQETPAPGYTIRRDLFDQALADAAKRPVPTCGPDGRPSRRTGEMSWCAMKPSDAGRSQPG